jgi:hypothetical protein
MNDHFDRFPQGESPRVKRAIGSPSTGKFLEDTVLADLLDRLDNLPPEACYPLQLSFYRKMLECDLLLPVPVGTQIQAGIPLMTLENPQGEVGLPIFTSEDALARWDDEPTEYIILPFHKLCGYAVEAKVDFIIVNVGGPQGCEISLRDFSYLAENLIPPPSSGAAAEKANASTLPVDVNAGTPTRLGTAQKLPQELMQRVKHIFSRNSELIHHAYHFEIAFNDGPLQPAIAVQIATQAKPDWEARLWPDMQAILNEMLERRTVVNVFLLNDTPSLATQIRSVCQPIFVGSASAEN